MANSIVFFGSSTFSLPVLEKLQNVQLVVTTPDQPVGRHLKLTPNPVKVWGQEHDIEVIEEINNLKLKNKNSTALVAAYGKIIPQQILDIFNGRIYNIHPSLLPKYRGPSPLQHQILDGVTETGVTVIRLDSQMDHGPIVAQASDIILPADTPETLGNRLFAKGADLFLKAHHVKGIPQNDSEATYTHKLTRQDGFLPWNEFIKFDYQNKFRAYYPWPGIWSTNPEGLRVKLVSLTPPLVQLPGQPSPSPISNT